MAGMKVDTLILLVNGERIADAVPIEADSEGPGSYTFGKQTIDFVVPFAADDVWRIVYELPEGCYEMSLWHQGLTPGDTVELVFDGAGPTSLVACKRPRAFTEPLSTSP